MVDAGQADELDGGEVRTRHHPAASRASIIDLVYDVLSMYGLLVFVRLEVGTYKCELTFDACRRIVISPFVILSPSCWIV